MRHLGDQTAAKSRLLSIAFVRKVDRCCGTCFIRLFVLLFIYWACTYAPPILIIVCNIFCLLLRGGDDKEGQKGRCRQPDRTNV